MTKQQKEKLDNLYKFSDENYMVSNEKEKINKKKSKDREKRIKKKNTLKKDQFDLDKETVIGMTNKNHQANRKEIQNRIYTRNFWYVPFWTFKFGK